MDLFDSGPVALAAAVRGGAVGSEELVRAFLDRIARLDPSLGAFVSVRADGALRDARKKDADRARGRPLPPFHGVPIGIKDLNLVRFSRTGFGTRALPALWSPVDDRTVARLRAAGFVILGKLATSELGAVPITEPRGRPPARNPWDPERTPGGSSGGSAAAVASGMLPVAHGSDGGGSIRIPASLCGLVGLKASRGRLANAFGIDDPALIYTCGALVRSVGDAAAMLDVMAGGGKGGLPLPERPFATLAEAGPERPLRVRMTVDVPLVETDPAIRAAVLRVAETLAAAGHHVEEVPPPDADIDEFLPIWQDLIASLRWIPASRMEPTTRWLAEAGRRLPRGAARARQAELTARWRPWQEGADVLLTPTVAVPPPAVGAYAGWDAEAHFKAAAALGIFTAPFNVTGQPAITVPIGLHPTLGTPMGAQLAGAIGSEATLLAVAREIERALPWAHLRPRVHGAEAAAKAS